MLIMGHLWDSLILTSYGSMVLSSPLLGKPIGLKYNCFFMLYIYIYKGLRTHEEMRRKDPSSALSFL